MRALSAWGGRNARESSVWPSVSVRDRLDDCLAMLRNKAFLNSCVTARGAFHVPDYGTGRLGHGRSMKTRCQFTLQRSVADAHGGPMATGWQCAMMRNRDCQTGSHHVPKRWGNVTHLILCA